MYRSYLTQWGLTVLAATGLTVFIPPAFGELKPGSRLDKSNCQEAKDLLPDHILKKFCSGQYTADIIEVKDDEFQYSRKFKSGSESNAGKYYVTNDGYMYETATKTWPHYWYGFPFPVIDEEDPQAGYKVMYNHQVARFQVDDVYWFLAIKWATPSGFDRSVEFGAYATWYIGRHSGPMANPDDCYLKDIIFGVAPYDVVGVSTLEWWPTDPEKWQSIWSYIPTIRRVRRVTASNTSEGLFGSIIARDDAYGWAGKIQYMTWQLVGVKDVLVPIAPSGIEKAMVAGDPAPKKLPSDPTLIKAKGEIPLNQVARITWSPEERIIVGYEKEGWQGAVWAPTNLKLAKRRCWIVEATPKDPYYAYGRRVLYIDKTAYWAYWATLYNRAGEYWKTLLWMDKMAYTPGRDMTVRHPFWGMAEDVRQNRASFFDVQSKGYYTEYEVGFPDSIYGTTNLSAMG
ncbi:MAG TPA: DUF1329 domain-containing protein, partial [Candidatus Binatia bacterium]|nr:DUF1329 domain-containing protein [Candidatus Binatia bacterium]